MHLGPKSNLLFFRCFSASTLGYLSRSKLFLIWCAENTCLQATTTLHTRDSCDQCLDALKHQNSGTAIGEWAVLCHVKTGKGIIKQIRICHCQRTLMFFLILKYQRVPVAMLLFAATYFCSWDSPRRAVNEGIDFVGQGWAVGTSSNKAKNCWALWPNWMAA